MYDEDLVAQQINSIPNREGVALDIGANRGIYTRRIAPKFEKVYAFEPHPDNIKHLQERTIQFDNVEIIQGVISDVDGPAKLYNCIANHGGHTLSKAVMEKAIWGHSPDDFLEVVGTTLDTFCKDKKVSFMKVDVEAAEDRIFNSAIETLKNNKLDMIVEVHQFVDYARLYKFFADLGFKVYDIDGVGRPETFIADQHYILSNR